MTLSHLRALLSAATPGPWRHEPPDSGYDGPEIIGAEQKPGDNIAAGSWCLGDGYGTDSNLNEANADLIVAAVNSLPALLAVVEAAQAWRDADEQLDRCSSSEAVIIEYELRRSQLRTALLTLESQ